MAIKFNNEQIQAIESRCNEILVAAGAGSGKSTVLVERLMQKIINDGVNVDEFLILTFTNLAAREMIDKLRMRLNDVLAENPDSVHLQHQIYKIPYGNISTFHGFCNKVLQRYYYLVDLDVNMQLMDEMDAVMLRADVLDDFMNEMYADKEFRLLVDVFGTDRSDDPLADLLIKVYEISRANPNMEVWLSSLTQLYQLEGNTVDGWAFYSQVKALIYPLLDAATRHVLVARETAIAAQMTDVVHGYVEMSAQDLAVIDALRVTIKTGTYDEVRNLLFQTKLPNFPMRSKKMCEHWAEDLHIRAKESRNQFSGILNILSKDFFAYRNESHVLHFAHGAEIVGILARVILLFDARFLSEKVVLSKIDFSDLERFTLKIFRSNPEVLSEVASNFKEIMIDEYQDTNEMQEEIVQLLKKAQNVPVFMVGDVKQSIYRFRLAEPSIFQRKYVAYKLDEQSGKKINLMQNYRSSRRVIDGINYLFERVMDVAVGEIEYDEAAKLKCGVDVADDAFNVPQLHVIDKAAFCGADEGMEALHHTEVEAHHVAYLIKRIIDEDAPVYVRGVGNRPVKYDDIVILMRSMSESMVFHNILTAHSIPVFTEQAGNLLTTSEVMTLLALLRIIDNPYQDIPLVATMRSPLFFFTEPELAKIRMDNKTLSFYDAVKKFVTTSSTTALHLKVKDFLLKLKNWRYTSRFSTVADLLRQIYEQTAYYDFVLGLAGGDMRRENLDLFEQVSAVYETRTKKGLYRFLHYIDHLQQLGKMIPIAQSATGIGASVKIMTIHKSKGLEFPIVFITSMQKKFNTQDEIGDYVLHKNDGMGVQYINPDLRLKQKTIVTTMLAKKLRHEMIAEEMRLLYVALTRAKSKLILTGVMKDGDAITKLAAANIAPTSVRLAANCYLDWVLPVVAESQLTNPWQCQIITQIEVNTTEHQDQNVVEKTPPFIDFEAVFNRNYPFEALTEIIAKQSVSQRKIEETVPMYKGIPEAMTEVAYDRPSFIQHQTKATEIGTAFHQIMQHLPFENDHTLASIISLKDTLVTQAIIKSELAQQVNLKDIYHFTKSALYRQIQHAEKIQKELPFTMLIQVGETKQAKAMLQGVVDLLAEFKTQVWVIDYKTDRVKDFKMQQLKLKQRYEVQMKYYLQAIRDIYPNKKVVAHVYFMRVGKEIVYE